MLYVAAFAVSSYSGSNNRFLKPFNPLLGETFEFEFPEKKWRALAEKVVFPGLGWAGLGCAVLCCAVLCCLCLYCKVLH